MNDTTSNCSTNGGGCLRLSLRSLLAIVLVLSMAAGPVLATGATDSESARESSVYHLDDDVFAQSEDDSDGESDAGEEPCVSTADTEGGSGILDSIADTGKQGYQAVKSGKLLDPTCLVVGIPRAMIAVMAEQSPVEISPEQLERRYGTPAPQVSGDDPIYSEPEQPLWKAVQKNTWFGGITGMTLVLLIVAAYARTTASIFGFGSSYQAKKFKSGLYQPGALILLWYLIISLSLLLVRELGLAFLPSAKRVTAVWAALHAQGMATNVATFGVTAPVTALFLLVAGICELVVQAMFVVQGFMLPIYALIMPFLFIGIYSEIPVLSSWSTAIAKRIVPLMFLRYPAILVTWAFVNGISTPSKTGGAGCIKLEGDVSGFACLEGLGVFVGPMGMALVNIVIAYLTYKLLTMSIPLSGGGVKSKASTLAGVGVYSATGNVFAASAVSQSGGSSGNSGGSGAAGATGGSTGGGGVPEVRRTEHVADPGSASINNWKGGR